MTSEEDFHFPTDCDLSVAKLIDEVFDDESAIVFAFETRILTPTQLCGACGSRMELKEGVVFVDPFHWSCTNRKTRCCLTKSLRVESFFSTSLFGMRSIVLIVHLWFLGNSPSEIASRAGVNHHSADNWCLQLRSTCRRFVERNQPEELGRACREVEVGVYDSRRLAMAGGRRVVVLVERDSPRIPVIQVVDRNEDAAAVIRRVVVKGTRIVAHSDCQLFDAESLRLDYVFENAAPKGVERAPLANALIISVMQMGHRTTNDHLKFFEVVYRQNFAHSFRKFIEIANEYGRPNKR